MFRDKNPKTGDLLDSYVQNTDFNDIVELYNFDANLRSACLNVLAGLEVYFTSVIAHEIGKLNPYAYLDLSILNPNATAKDKNHHDAWITRYEKIIHNSRNEICVIHHMENYNGKLPVWAMVEIIDWGSLSVLYSLCSLDIQKNICSHLDSALTPKLLKSWLQTLNIFRNYCAHNSRLWNRKLTIRPARPNANIFREFANLEIADVPNDKIFLTLSIIQYLCSKISPAHLNLIPLAVNSLPTSNGISSKNMGFPLSHWREHPLWKIN
jgi:abortive infection bacteriophage resistance protein